MPSPPTSQPLPSWPCIHHATQGLQQPPHRTATRGVPQTQPLQPELAYRATPGPGQVGAWPPPPHRSPAAPRGDLATGAQIRPPCAPRDTSSRRHRSHRDEGEPADPAAGNKDLVAPHGSARRTGSDDALPLERSSKTVRNSNSRPRRCEQPWHSTDNRGQGGPAAAILAARRTRGRQLRRRRGRSRWRGGLGTRSEGTA